MRLIDADALLSKYISNKYKGNILTAQTDYAQGARDIIEDIIDAPTIEPAQKKAKWVFGTTMNRGWMKCSNCCVSQTPCGTFSYCPNCGAKMEGEENENKS